MTDPQRRTIDTPEGPYVVYHRDTAGLPNAHQHPGGPWYFQPASYTGDVYSKGYPSPEAASEAAWAWAQQLQDEEREAVGTMQQIAPTPGPEHQR